MLNVYVGLTLETFTVQMFWWVLSMACIAEAKLLITRFRKKWSIQHSGLQMPRAHDHEDSMHYSHHELLWGIEATMLLPAAQSLLSLLLSDISNVAMLFSSTSRYVKSTCCPCRPVCSEHLESSVCLCARCVKETDRLIPEDALNPGLPGRPLSEGGPQLLVGCHAGSSTVGNLSHPDGHAISFVQGSQLALNGCQRSRVGVVPQTMDVAPGRWINSVNF